MPEGVAESPEFGYDIRHKEPFFDKINPAIRGAGMDIQDVLSFTLRSFAIFGTPFLDLKTNLRSGFFGRCHELTNCFKK